MPQVTGNYFGDRAATLACKQLKLGGPGKAVWSKRYFGVSKASACLLNVACNGTEPGLQWCAYQFGEGEDCDHNKDLGIFCNGMLP